MSEFDWTKIDGDWKSAEKPEGRDKPDFAELPDGPYVCVIDRAEFRTSKSGNPMMSMTLIVNSGPHENRRIFKRNMLGSPQNMTFLKKDLAACGVDLPDKLSDLPLESLLDKVIKVTKKTNRKDGKDFENIYIDRVVADMRSAGPPTSTQEYNDDDIPF